MKYKVYLLTYLLLAIPTSLMATSKDLGLPPKVLLKENKQNSKIADEPNPSLSNKKIWMQNIEQTLPGLLCDSKKYFVDCFSVTQEECVDFTKLIVHACLSNIQVALPQEIEKSQGEYWGQMVGKCSYDLYEKFMQSKKLPKPGCVFITNNKDDLPKPSQATP
ncbi:MAG: hypothetical protein JSR17_00770 [Proteobacteria bacterium]|nr:hypothetical protein [Pseudomonadota bacterium]